MIHPDRLNFDIHAIQTEMLNLACSLFGRRSKDTSAASAAAAVPESPRSQLSFEAERAQHAEDIAALTSEKAKQQACFPTRNLIWHVPLAEHAQHIKVIDMLTSEREKQQTCAHRSCANCHSFAAA